MYSASEKVKKYFCDVSINKSLVEKIGLRERPIPSFVVDWLVRKYSTEDDIDLNSINSFIEKYMPDRSKKEEIKHRLLTGENVKLLDALKVEVDLNVGRYKATLSSVSLSNIQIDQSIVCQNPILLYGSVWGQVELAYRLNEEGNKNEVYVDNFKVMQTGEIDLDYFIEQRRYFTLEEWIDILIASMGYAPDFYPFEQRIYMILRLIPMVQSRVNLMELAPKGTGKSTVFSRLSRYLWLISGGVVTRAQLFYNMKDKTEGIITFYDAIILDEVQTIKFTDPGEIIGALKGYLENGEYRVMGHRGTAEAGFVILANIKIGSDWLPVNKFLLAELPEFLQETAFLDRFHGIIPGWRLKRIEKRAILKSGFALRADYFYEVLNKLRKKTEYDDYVKKHLHSTGDIRDYKAVERISTGLLKLLYPDLSIVNTDLFEKYCVNYAKEARQIVREQLSLKDPEYKKDLAQIEVI
ncbi:MAG: BREX system Lon protease-like protein BrxL [Nitrospirota bacterium]